MGLSIDGGGMRGIIPAQIIEYFSEECKLEPYQMFDVIGGTSIGGILALGISTTRDKGNGDEPILMRNQLV